PRRFPHVQPRQEHLPPAEAGHRRHRRPETAVWQKNARDAGKGAETMIIRRIDGRARDLGGGFKVRRVLPSAQQRLVGPFIFWDHFGPATYAPGERFDVRPHPHINLATVTYLFEGEIFHRDSLGSAQAIRPGPVNWMT